MKHIKTYEGFLSKVKDLFIGKEEPAKVINNTEIESLLKDCFVELEDNGFSVTIENSKSNMRSRPNGDVYFDEVPSTKFIVCIDKEINTYFTDFEINEIRDSILFSIDMMKERYDPIVECYYHDKLHTIGRGNTFDDEFDEYNIKLKGKSYRTNYNEVEKENWEVSEFNIVFNIFG